METAAITAQLVKTLREETGSKMMDCKRALKDADGNYEVAKRLLLKPPAGPDEPEALPVE